jgi:RNA polymerase sigma-70 factor, ECF subfamily
VIHLFRQFYRIVSQERKKPEPVLLAALNIHSADDVSPDAALVQRLLRRDVNAFEQIYKRHARIVYSLVLRILRQVATAEEVVQEIFLQVWRNSAQYDARRGPFTPWLLTLARNRALDHLRLKGERQRRVEDQSDPLVSGSIAKSVSPPRFEEALDEKRRGERVRALIGALPAQQRKALELAYFEGLSHSEIAAALKEPLGTVKSWIRSALLKLKQELQANP